MPDPAKYDLFINLDDAYESNPMNNYMDSYFYRAFGNTAGNKQPELFPTEFDKDIVNSFCLDNEINDFIVIHIRQWHWALKNMSMDTWFEVFEKLFTEKSDFKVVCVGGITDGFVEHPLFVDARDKLTPQQLKLLMDNAGCFVGTDSGPYHIASTTNTHIVALLTHLLPERILPYRAGTQEWNTTAIMSNVACVGCNDRQRRPVSHIVCEPGGYPCANSFDATRIANVILEVL
jgi:ADP-heptose:LPS heptosyltransferase